MGITFVDMRVACLSFVPDGLSKDLTRIKTERAFYQCGSGILTLNPKRLKLSGVYALELRALCWSAGVQGQPFGMVLLTYHVGGFPTLGIPFFGGFPKTSQP